MAFTRLRADELVNVWAADRHTPMQIALLGVFDAGPFRRADGAVDTAGIRAALAARARRVPALGRRVVWTRLGEGRPIWVADPWFDPLRHVGAVTLPPGAAPGSWAAGRALRPLRRDRPLWRAEVVEGLPGGRFAVLIVVSHVLADGRTGVALAGALLDPAADTGLEEPAAAAVPPLPTHRELLRVRLHDGVAALRRARPDATGRRRGRQGLEQLRDLLSDLGAPVPRTSLPRRTGPGRRLAVARHPLADLQRAGHALHVTVNDLLLAAVAGGLRQLFAARGEQLPGLVVRASVPAATGLPGQQVMGMLVVDLPVGEPDPLRRLALICHATTAGKARLRAGVGSVVDIRLPAPVARLVVRWGRRFGSRSISLSVTDLAGPSVPLWLAGARLVEAVPIAPLVLQVPLAVAALSYAGELVVTVNADAAITDVDVLAGGIAQAFTDLTGLTGAAARCRPSS
ncbi:wax ester/triacylglycerol synthase domain-containing protein [Geodermatophilus ruber]|uniref:diacylglycerol O-acyltransferase n=1 Tax=Geodermatophilus ruber TaxID=504800 RepID=A0A1I4E1M1_9ACTN|nr:wax ester/triacylglycerol synthase domain-containing protein [Geodermatophilus ruber]SFK99685.1 acyltransferase, WS/DGAT/MGAT [Geodermatophilus ruber]